MAQTSKTWNAIIRELKPLPDYTSATIIDPGKGLPLESVKMIHFKTMARFFEVAPQCPTLTGISLKGVSIPFSSMFKVFDSTNRNLLPILNTLGLLNQPNLLKTLDCMGNLTVLDLSHCQICDSSKIPQVELPPKPARRGDPFIGSLFDNVCPNVCARLMSITTLTDLNLSDNGLLSVAVSLEDSIKKRVANNTTLKKLNLANNKLKIFDLLPDPAWRWKEIVTLDLSGNCLVNKGINGVQQLVWGLENSPCLKQLTLDNSALTEADQETLKEKFPGIEFDSGDQK